MSGDLVFKQGQCWRDAQRNVRRLRDTDKGDAFEEWLPYRGEWYAAFSPGPLPHTPCEDPSQLKPRGVWETVRWCYENEGRAAHPVQYPGSHVEFGRSKGLRYHYTNGMVEPFQPASWAGSEFLPVKGDWDDES